MKARITHPDGTIVDIEGTPDDLARVVAVPPSVIGPAPIQIAWPPAGWLPRADRTTIDRYGLRTGDVTCTASWELVEMAVAS